MHEKSHLLEAEPKQTQIGNKAQIFNRKNDWLLEQSVMACNGPFFSQVFHTVTGHHMKKSSCQIPIISPTISLAGCILMVCKVRLANLIKPPTLKLCKSRSVVSYLPPRTYHEDWGILKQEPCPRCNYFQGMLAIHHLADLIALYNHFADTETAPQRAKQTINKLVSFALWLQVSRVTFCLLVQLWPSWWFWWTRINISWHISLPVTDHNILTLLNSDAGDQDRIIMNKDWQTE